MQGDEDELLRSVALQNATSIALARRRAEQELIRVKEALEAKTEDLARALAATEASLAERDRARAEADVARQSAQDASTAKSRFLSMISHELRTPLGAIGGYASLLDEDIAGALNKEQRSYVERIRHNQAHILQLVNELLDLARIESGQFPLKLDTVSLQEVLDHMYPMIEPQIRASELRVELSTGDPTLVVRADRERLEQIVLNLLSNAIKFTPPHGEVRVAVSSSPRELQLHVVDTGIGIPSDQWDAVFEPFVQVAGSRVHGGGTGLGLAISRELARAMGGDLTLESVLGRGSTLTLRLPRASGTPRLQG